MLDKIAMKIAWMLPRRIAYWCAVRVAAHATAGKWSTQDVPDLRVLDALTRWEA